MTVLDLLAASDAPVVLGLLAGSETAGAPCQASGFDNQPTWDNLGCGLSSLRWEGGKLSRVRFETCKLLGADFTGVSLEHVVFVGCKLDYSTLDKVRATGPVLFVRCSLPEAEFTGCDLPDALFDDCDLRLTVFGERS